MNSSSGLIAVFAFALFCGVMALSWHLIERSDLGQFLKYAHSFGMRDCDRVGYCAPGQR